MTDISHQVFSAALFDMDGVLLDSTQAIDRSWALWAERQNISWGRLRAKIHGTKATEVIRSFTPHLDVEEELQTLIAQEQELLELVTPYEGAQEVLTALAEVPWAVVTSAPRTLAIARLTHLELPKPRVIICAEEVSQGKPSPDGYLKAAELLGIDAADCVVFEDSLPGIQAGKAAQMTVVGLATTEERARLGQADRILGSMEEVARLLDVSGGRIHIAPDASDGTTE
ncbi:HAD family hydrolase [Rhodospirillum sp. A1_3_36]|uniref:HAD family hydrolase n=1 Tax=Rhodospirillum sp. A1_3_36 TaxID=3391666 RepID=UPI0039A40A50